MARRRRRGTVAAGAYFAVKVEVVPNVNALMAKWERAIDEGNRFALFAFVVSFGASLFLLVAKQLCADALTALLTRSPSS